MKVLTKNVSEKIVDNFFFYESNEHYCDFRKHKLALKFMDQVELCIRGHVTIRIIVASIKSIIRYS